MEELHSTEALDREILEDARKKAFKILKTADDTVNAQTQRWEKKTKRAVEEIRRNYAGRVEKVKEEILARLPLDKRRLRSETAENILRGAMETFLQNLSRRQILSVLEREFASRLAACIDWGGSTAENPPALLYSGMSESEVKEVLTAAVAESGIKVAACDISGWNLQKDESPGASKFPAAVLNMSAVRIAASVEDAAAGLLDDKRAELAAALLGEGVLND
jgi:hypothetical protein